MIRQPIVLGDLRLDLTARLEKGWLDLEMIPNYVSTNTVSRAEGKVFRAFERTRLPGDWYVLHSLDLARHPTKPYGEIDFLVVGSLGVFLLEVKGGRLACRDGVWSYTDRFGEEHRSSEGPFHQARTALHALRDHLGRTLGSRELDRVVFGFGVVLPDVRFRVSGIEFDQDIVLDGDEFPEGVEAYVERLDRYWRRKLPPKPERIPRELVRSIVDLLRPDFETVRSIRAITTDVEQRQVSLTERQYEVLDSARNNQRVLVRGGAGTGKTLIAVELARREAAAGRSVLLVCHNPMLARFLQDQLVNEPFVKVEAASRLLVRMSRRFNVMPSGYSASLSATDPWFEEELLPAVSAVRSVMPDDEKVDTLVVDEAQDLFSIQYLDVLGAHLKGGLERGRWRIFHDRFNQGAIRGLVEAEEVEELLADGAVLVELDRNCRNTGAIITQTRLATGADLSRPIEIEGVPVTIEAAAGRGVAATKLEGRLADLVKQGADPKTITILAPESWESSSASLLPPNRASRVVRLSMDGVATHPAAGISFSTIADFKGLENSHLCIVDVEGIDSNPAMLSELYVAMTRARVSLWMAVSEEANSRLVELMTQRWPMIAEGVSGGRS